MLCTLQLNPLETKINLSYVIAAASVGLEVACWPLVPKFAGSNPAEAVGFFRACKRTRKCMRGSRSFRSKLPAISRPSSSSFH